MQALALLNFHVPRVVLLSVHAAAHLFRHTLDTKQPLQHLLYSVSYVSDTSRVYPLCVMHIIKSTESEQKT